MKRPLGAVVGLVCVAFIASGGSTFASQSRWSALTEVPNGVFSISCPSAQLCVAGTDEGVIVSRDPGGGANAWVQSVTPRSRRGFGAAVHGVACPSTSFCVAVGTGSILTSSDPAGGASAWKVTPISLASYEYLDGVACASTSLCVAFARSSREQSFTDTAAPRNGRVWSTTDPGGGTSAWKAAVLRDVPDYVTCLPSVCVLATEDGDILTARHPTAGPRAWKTVHVFGVPGKVAFIPVIACASTHYCLAPLGGIAERGELRTRNLFDRKPFSWSYSQGFGGAKVPALESGLCVSNGFCAFGATVGNGRSARGEVVSSAGPGKPWATKYLPHGTFDVEVSCPSSQFCVVAGSRLVPPQNLLGGYILVRQG